MPGVATAQLLSYAEIVDVALDQTNDVNLADAEDYGHRLIVDVDIGALNGYLRWKREAGSARPVADLDASKEGIFKAALENALGTGYTDIDGVTDGLHFGSAVLSTNTDARLRAGGISANDLPMAYILYKLYGKSAADTLDHVFNLGDAHAMLLNSTVATAITQSFKDQVSGSLDSMFRDLLASDPHRFFDAAGVPAAGLFETKTDAVGAGGWNITEEDKLEVKLKLTFQSPVTRRGVAGGELNISTPENAAGAQNNQQTMIAEGDYFYIRLQLRAKTIYVEMPYTPNMGTGLALWLDANDANSFTLGANGAVSFWGDKSGNSRNGVNLFGTVQRQANTFNGKPSVYFNYGAISSADNAFTGTNAATTVTVFNVYRFPQGTAQSVTRHLQMGGTMLMVNGEGLAAAGHVRSVSSSWESSTAMNVLPSNTNMMLYAQQAPTLNTMILNGNEAAKATGGAGRPTWYNVNGRWYIGLGGSTNAEMNGNVAEMAVFLGAMTTEDRQKVEGYLAHKWGLADKLPAAHPYKAAGPTVMVALSA
jgi:hypothetical protein